MTHQTTDRPAWPLDAISGTWHLLHAQESDIDIPNHRMDLRIDYRPEQLRTAVLSRITGEEMLMVHRASFDGLILELQLIAPAGRTQAEMPTLRMSVSGTKLQGEWRQNDVPVPPGLKLVRATIAAVTRRANRR